MQKRACVCTLAVAVSLVVLILIGIEGKRQHRRLRYRVCAKRKGIDACVDPATTQPTPRHRVVDRWTFAGGGDGARRHHRHIVALSLWGTSPVYVDGALAVVRDVERLLSATWKSRVYVPQSLVTSGVARRLFDAGAEVYVMSCTDPIGCEGAVWRFLAADGPPEFAGQIMAALDADDKLGKVYHEWITEWERQAARGGSGIVFTLQESIDTKLTLPTPIKAGRWGAVVGAMPFSMQERIDSYAFRSEFGFDEAFLAEMVWPWVQRQMARGKVFCYDLSIVKLIAITFFGA
jgi:hypothetical protein